MGKKFWNLGLWTPRFVLFLPNNNKNIDFTLKIAYLLCVKSVILSPGCTLKSPGVHKKVTPMPRPHPNQLYQNL